MRTASTGSEGCGASTLPSRKMSAIGNREDHLASLRSRSVWSGRADTVAERSHTSEWYRQLTTVPTTLVVQITRLPLCVAGPLFAYTESAISAERSTHQDFLCRGARKGGRRCGVNGGHHAHARPAERSAPHRLLGCSACKGGHGTDYGGRCTTSGRKVWRTRDTVRPASHWRAWVRISLSNSPLTDECTRPSRDGLDHGA